jgi:bacterioferritin-associated ferredoxin
MLVCHCKNIKEFLIRKVIKEGCHELDDIIDYTGVCTGCGSCEPIVEDILDEELENLSST